MKKVLFVNCCIRKEDSRSLKLAKHFIDSLDKDVYQVEELCLMDEPLEFFKDSFLSKGKDFLKIRSLTIRVSDMLGSLRKLIKLSLPLRFGI